MILFQSLVERVVGPVHTITAQDLADRTWIGLMTIGSDSLWRLTNRLEYLLEKTLGCVPVSLLTHHAINQTVMTVKSTRQRAPCPLNLHVGFILPQKWVKVRADLRQPQRSDVDRATRSACLCALTTSRKLRTTGERSARCQTAWISACVVIPCSGR